LENHEIRQIAKDQEYKDAGFKLSSALDLYTQGERAEVEGYNKDLLDHIA
tara:strand:+ start:188 stop:337 length:150 start_codon:yes stop_codon:yes gene_type:complete